MIDDELAKCLRNEVQGETETLANLADKLFPESSCASSSLEERKTAVLNLANLVSIAEDNLGNKILPARLHMMFRGLDSQFACIDPLCPHRRV